MMAPAGKNLMEEPLAELRLFTDDEEGNTLKLPLSNNLSFPPFAMPLSVFFMIIPVTIYQKLLTNHDVDGDRNAISKKALSIKVEPRPRDWQR